MMIFVKVSVPLRGLCKLKLRNDFYWNSWGNVSVPLRGLCKLKQPRIYTHHQWLLCFSPLAGIMQIETWNGIALVGVYSGGKVSVPLRGLCKLKLNQSFSPFFYVINVSVPLRGLCKLKLSELLRQVLLLIVFQSPCGDYANWNWSDWEIMGDR